LEFEVEHGSIEFEEGSLPSSLKSLGFPRDFRRSLSTMKDTFLTLPNLSTFVFNNLTLSNELNVNTVPSSIKRIKIKHSFDFGLSEFNGLASLLIDQLEIGSFNDAKQTILRPGFFPKSLKELQFDTSFYQDWDILFLPGSLSEGLEKLILPPSMYPFVPGVLPSSLKHLKLRVDYRFPLTDLPPDLHYLILDCGFSSRKIHPTVRIPKSQMPANLQISLSATNGYHIRRYNYIEPDQEPKPQAQPTKKRKGRDASEVPSRSSKKFVYLTS
jgi:hypothetical protein